MYILVTMEPILFNDDINFQFDARAMTSQNLILSDDFQKILTQKQNVFIIERLKLGP